MRHLIGRRAICMALASAGMVAVWAADTPWRWFELGPIALRAPADMVSRAGGADSTAGTLTNDRLQVDYDFGAHTDPLQVPPPDARDFQASATTVAGLPARAVRYVAVDEKGRVRRCAAVHVAQVRMSPRGRIGLTVMACGRSEDALQQASEVFASLRLRASSKH